MARATFGGGSSDYVFRSTTGNLVILDADTVVTLWDDPDAGTRHTDLLLDDQPVDRVMSDVDGRLPVFQGPDGVLAMWADTGAGSRVQITAGADIVYVGIAAAQTASGEAQAASTAASGSAAQAADALGDIVGLSGIGVVGLALDTDGQPYFDPTITGVTPTLALGVDTDGVPYLIGA